MGEYPINVRLLGVRLSSLEQKKPQSKSQKQLNDFWKVKKENDDKDKNVEDEIKELVIKKEDKNKNNKRKRKRNWNEKMKESEIDNDEILEDSIKKRRKLGKQKDNTSNLYDVDMKDRNEDIDVDLDDRNVQRKDKMTLSQMFEKQKKKNKNKEIHKDKPKERQTLVCPICCSFECVSNLQLNVHLDQCLKTRQHKKKKRKKSAKGTL